ncbi:MAG: LysR family transcriptional regulator [Bacteriovoracaceae bacterium]|nr:LysR family transcriptional regulator [Bacteriovoracaceae bacterium]
MIYTVAYGATMNLDYNLLKTFSKVSELGSFTMAAHVLKQPKSRVSRSISRLENELGVELIRRTTRRISLTSAGSELFNNIAIHLRGIENELIKISDGKDKMSGTIRITTSDSIAQYVLSEVVSRYNLKFPDVKLEMIVTNDYMDLVKENIDLAFRAGKLKDSVLIQKKFIATSFVLVCSKKFKQKYSLPTSLEKLRDYNFLSFIPLENSFAQQGIEVNSILATDSLPMLLKMALDGAGITILPSFLCQKYIDSKKLLRVLPSWEARKENIHIVYPPTKNLPKRVKTFIQLALSVLD